MAAIDTQSVVSSSLFSTFHGHASHQAAFAECKSKVSNGNQTVELSSKRSAFREGRECGPIRKRCSLASRLRFELLERSGFSSWKNRHGRALVNASIPQAYAAPAEAASDTAPDSFASTTLGSKGALSAVSQLDASSDAGEASQGKPLAVSASRGSNGEADALDGSRNQSDETGAVRLTVSSDGSFELEDGRSGRIGNKNVSISIKIEQVSPRVSRSQQQHNMQPLSVASLSSSVFPKSARLFTSVGASASAAANSPIRNRLFSGSGRVLVAVAFAAAGIITLVKSRADSQEMEADCFHCDSYGVTPCEFCGGSGIIQWEAKFQRNDPCPACYGDRFKKCTRCNGKCRKRGLPLTLDDADF